MKAEISEDGLHLIVTVPINERESASGKNIVIATSGGNQPTPLVYKEKMVTVGLNAYIKKD